MELGQLLYQVIEQKNISDSIASIFIQQLTKQGKVSIPSIEKVKTCFKMVLCFANEELIGIGALKLNQSSAFEKSGLIPIKDIFSLELGYFFVNESFRGLGISSAIARLLLLNIVNENVFATTELYADNPMLKTLEKLGFKHYGTPYRSIWHDGTIGLFLKFKRGKFND